MIDFADAAWNKKQFAEHHTHITRLLQSPVFTKSAPFSYQSQACWIELIRAISELVELALRAGKRIDFTEEVGTQDEPQDITSLLQSMCQSAYVFRPHTPVHPGLLILSPMLNHVYGMGNGYFTNGLGFHCEHDDELAFFVGRDRIYFYRHLIRAFIDASHYLQSLPG